MTAHDPSLARGGWRRWFGFGRGNGNALDDRLLADVHEALHPSRIDDRRLQTLAEITCFLIDHDLSVSPFTLEVAHDIVTGSNPTLAAMAADRLAQQQPLTQRWLEEVAQSASIENGARQMHALILRLEKTIEQFAHTSSAARHATSDYNVALEAHVDDLKAIETGGNVIEQITTLARDMLDRTREVARELTRSERETRNLQKQLADARAEAEIDHLTGLPNRRAFETRFEEECTVTRDQDEPLCVAFCDIDEFKRINDKHGHEAGDRVLRAVAQSLATISDDKCHVARHGGEEFVVLLRNKLVEEAWAVIDEAREALEARRLVNRATEIPFGRITFSAGVAEVHAYDDPRDALRAADEALLRAKQSGRNVVLKADAPN